MVKARNLRKSSSVNGTRCSVRGGVGSCGVGAGAEAGVGTGVGAGVGAGCGSGTIAGLIKV